MLSPPPKSKPCCAACTINRKLLEGEFRPGGVHREWCDPDVLQQIRRKTLARLRKEVVPAEQHVFARLLARWQGVAAPRRGLDALLDAIEILQGAELIASDLEREILPARVADYKSSDLDALLASGEIVWVGREPLGTRDGRVSLYLAGSLGSLLAPSFGGDSARRLSPKRRSEFWSSCGNREPRFKPRFIRRSAAASPTKPPMRSGNWCGHGLITNDTFSPIRALLSSAEKERPRVQHRHTCRPDRPAFSQRARARRGTDGVGEGRWSAVLQRIAEPANRDGVERRHRPAVAGAQRHRDARNGRRRKRPRRLCGCLSGAQNHGRERLDPSRHVRRRNGRGAVRHSRRGRHAAQSARATASARRPSTWRHPTPPIPTAAFFRGSKAPPITRCRVPPAPTSSW